MFKNRFLDSKVVNYINIYEKRIDNEKYFKTFMKNLLKVESILELLASSTFDNSMRCLIRQESLDSFPKFSAGFRQG